MDSCGFWKQIKLTRSSVGWAKRFVNINTTIIIFIHLVKGFSVMRAKNSSVGSESSFLTRNPWTPHF